MISLRRLNERAWRGLNRVQQTLALFILAGTFLTVHAQIHEDADVLSNVRALVKDQKFAEAESQIRNYVKLYPNSASGHFLFGYILFSEHKPTESLAEYTAGARFQNPSAEDLMAVGADYILLKDNEDADKWLTRVTVMEPANALAWYYLGRTRFYESRYEEAAKIFLTCLKLKPADVRAQTNLGLAYSEMGREPEAIAAYQQAIQWEEQSGAKDGQPYLDLGSLLARTERVQQGLPYLQKAVQLEGNNPKTHEELGRAYEQLHREDEAEAEMRKAVALAPGSSALHYALAKILKAQGKTTEASKEFAMTSHLNGTNSSKEVPNFDLNH